MIVVKCINRFKDNNSNIIGYRLQDQFGVIKNISSNRLKHEILQGNIQVDNLRLTQDNRLTLLSTVDNMAQVNKYDRLKRFEAKQLLLNNKIFDFALYNGDILIVKYYDNPLRKEIQIPDFVDGFNTYETDPGIEFGAFDKCTYVEKVIAHSNIKGSTRDLFNNFLGERLDLTEFNTINITDTSEMFGWSHIGSIILGNKFNTTNVELMTKMFCYCKTNSITLGNNFNTANVVDMCEMFEGCQAESLILGNKFDMSKVEDAEYMFVNSIIPTVNLGSKFIIPKRNKCEYMFRGSSIDNMIIDKKLTKTAKKLKNYRNVTLV